MLITDRSMRFGGFYSPPFMDYGPDQQLQGPLIELASRIAAFHDLHPEFVNLNQNQLNTFPSTDVDIGMGVFRTSRRSALGEFSVPLFEFELQGLVFESVEGDGMDLVSAPGISVGVKEGNVGYDFLADEFGLEWVHAHCKVILATSSAEPWELLDRHEVDIILCDHLTLEHWRSRITMPTRYLFSRSISRSHMCFLVHAGSPLGVNDLNSWLIQNASTQSYRDFLMSVCRDEGHLFKACDIPNQDSLAKR